MSSDIIQFSDNPADSGAQLRELGSFEMRGTESSYFMRRAAEERAAAGRATCPQAAAAHRDMARRYAAMATGARGDAGALSA